MDMPKLRFRDSKGNNFLEWLYKSIKDIGTVYTGNTPTTSCLEYYGNEYPWITPSDIQSDSVIFSSKKMLSERGYKKCRQLPAGAVLITCIASIGKNVILGKAGSCNQQINAIVPKEDMSSYFILYALTMKTKDLLSLGGNGGMKIVKKSIFEKMLIPVPSLPEQHKIADFLSSYDEKISIQRERVEALERRKKGLLQKVFSQEIRFKADDGSEYPEWSNSSFSSVFASVGNNTFSRSDLTSDNSSNIRNIHYGDVLIKYGEIINTEVDSIPYIKKSISFPDNTDKLLQNGDIVFADTAEDNTVGKACEIALSDVRHKIVSGLHTIAIRPTIQFASGYLGFFLNSSLFHDQLLPLIQGIKVSSISKKALFEETRVYYPSYQEQQKISNLLTNISEQIKVEKERLSTMETIKKGLLQGLFC